MGNIISFIIQLSLSLPAIMDHLWNINQLFLSLSCTHGSILENTTPYIIQLFLSTPVPVGHSWKTSFYQTTYFSACFPDSPSWERTLPHPPSFPSPSWPGLILRRHHQPPPQNIMLLTYPPTCIGPFQEHNILQTTSTVLVPPTPMDHPWDTPSYPHLFFLSFLHYPMPHSIFVHFLF